MLFCIVLLLFSSTVYSSEFAHLASVKTMSSKSAGTGKAVSVSYGGFGMIISGELKNYENNLFPALYFGITNLQLHAALGITPHGLALRTGVNMPIFQHSEIPVADKLFLTIGIEKYFTNNEYTGVQIGVKFLMYAN